MPLTKIDTGAIKDDAINSAKIADGTVVASDVLDNTITGAKLASDIAISTSGTVTATSFSGDGASLTALNVSTDSTPQLGGDLDLNSNDITGTGNIDITGTVTADGLTFQSEGDAITFLTSSSVQGRLRTGDSFNTNSFQIEADNSVIINANMDDTNSSTNDAVFITTGSTFTATAKFDPSGDISFYEDTGTTPKFFWDASTERLGIGTSSPISPLTVNSGSNNVGLFYGNTGNNYIEISDNNNTNKVSFGSLSGGNAYLYSGSGKYTAFYSGASERMRIDDGGRVRIGNTSSTGHGNTYNLIVGNESSGGDAGVLVVTPNNENGYFAFGDADSSSSVASINYNHGSNFLRTYVNGSERMRIDSSGNVGIGTSSPDYRLKLISVYQTADSPYVFSAYNNSPGSTSSPEPTYWDIKGFAGQDRVRFISYDYSVNSGSRSKFVIQTRVDGGSLTDRFRIENDGDITIPNNVGIGTTNPSSPLTVSGGTNSTVANISNNVSTTTSLSTVLLLQSNTTGTAGVGHGLSIGFNGERNDGGTQRYGTLSWEANTNSGTALKTDFVVTSYAGHEVLRLKQTSVGNTNEMIAPDLLTTGTTSNRYPLYWVYNGSVGSIQPYTGSVREMKTDINDMGSVDWIHSLRPRSFKFRDFETNEDGSKTYLETTNNEPSTEYGLIAEEVNEVSGSDYILDKDENNNVKGVLYHNLVPILLKAVQEQKNTIQELEARITALETQP